MSTPMQPPPLPRQGVFCRLKSLFSFQTSKKGLNTGRFLSLWASFASPQIKKKLFLGKKRGYIIFIYFWEWGIYLLWCSCGGHLTTCRISSLLPHEIGGFTSHHTWWQTPLGTDMWWSRVYPSCLSDEHVTAVTVPPGSFCGGICLKQVIIPSFLFKVLLKFHC